MTWDLKCTWFVCCFANNAGNCYVRLSVAKSLTGFKLCATKSNNMQQGVQTDATCNIQQCCVLLRGALEYLHFCLSKALCKRTQHCWMLHVASVCTACCMLLRCCSVVNDNAYLHLLLAHVDPRSTLCNWLFNRQFENENSHSLKRFDKCVQSETVVPLSPKNKNKKKTESSTSKL